MKVNFNHFSLIFIDAKYRKNLDAMNTLECECEYENLNTDCSENNSFILNQTNIRPKIGPIY